MKITATDQSISLHEGYNGEPEQHLIDEHGVSSWENDLYEIVKINPREWYKKAMKGDVTIQQAYHQFATSEQKKIVQYYRRQAAHHARTTYLIIDSDNNQVKDGYHRLVAFALSGITEVKAIDISRPIENS